jgi:hypothetical protein
MPAIALHLHTPAFLGARRRRATWSLSLRRTASGWALLDEHGHAVFTGRGRDARRQCLARAAELGVLYLRFDEQLRDVYARASEHNWSQ